ncbi:hypothetical protein EZS27_000405 [termite gut metagenome]|uniref:DUF3078 domain-containing protein n=1 Tax=termite gut metagenome TaxID=433724 RepID=A0A5J4T3G3_9ZZZZ
MRTICISFMFMIFFPFLLIAQKSKEATLLPKENVLLCKDTVPSILYQRYFGKLDSLNNDTVPMRDIILDPDYYRLFIPLVYYNSPIKQVSKTNWKFQYPANTLSEINSEYLGVDTRKFNKTRRTNETVNRILIKLYVIRPDLVVTTEDRMMNLRSYREEKMKVTPKISVTQLFKPEGVKEDVGEAKFLVRKPNFWYTGGEGSLQMTQNYISDNWYKGGESNHALLSNLRLFANYNDKENLQFENIFEMKLGFNTVSPKLDTIRTYRTNTDVFRLSSKLGLQAFSTWYYTLSGEFNTQLFHNYKANANDVVSALMSPGNLALSVGMDYKLRRNTINLSVIVSPFSYNCRWVTNSKVDETKFGLKQGKHSLENFGSKVQATLSWKIVSTVTLDSRFYYFTDYDKVEAELENTLNLVLNRYFSTKLFVHYRFDDGIKRKEDNSYLQVKEFLSFGMNYKW